MKKSFTDFDDQQLIDINSETLPDKDFSKLNIVLQQRILESLNLVLEEIQKD